MEKLPPAEKRRPLFGRRDWIWILLILAAAGAFWLCSSLRSGEELTAVLWVDGEPRLALSLSDPPRRASAWRPMASKAGWRQSRAGSALPVWTAQTKSVKRPAGSVRKTKPQSVCPTGYPLRCCLPDRSRSCPDRQPGVRHKKGRNCMRFYVAVDLEGTACTVGLPGQFLTPPNPNYYQRPSRPPGRPDARRPRPL